jgi:hypothetical protein
MVQVYVEIMLCGLARAQLNITSACVSHEIGNMGKIRNGKSFQFPPVVVTKTKRVGSCLTYYPRLVR